MLRTHWVPIVTVRLVLGCNSSEEQKPGRSQGSPSTFSNVRWVQYMFHHGGTNHDVISPKAVKIAGTNNLINPKPRSEVYAQI